jgi:hypothetical protein
MREGHAHFEKCTHATLFHRMEKSFMDKSKQKLILIVISVLLIYSMIPQVIGLWQTIQLPLDEMVLRHDLWSQVGLLLLVPSLLIGVTFSLPQLEIEDRDLYQRPLFLNLVGAGIFQLIAAWRVFSESETQAGFYLLLAIFSFGAPGLIKQIRARLGS